MRTRRAAAFVLGLMFSVSGVAGGCGGDDGGGSGQNENENTNTNQNQNQNVNTSIDPDCDLARTTTYTAGDRGWCRFDRAHPALPELARNGLTFAIAEPWAGGSYEGEPGEACGECFEITSSRASEIVMVHDLCPIEGNPVCAGDFLHFDLSSETDEAMGTNGSGAIAVRPVPCPVTGNIHADVGDWNEWGYHKLTFFNHRIPVRFADVRAFPDGEWIPLERSGGGWVVHDGPIPSDGQGVVYRLESAQGQVVESADTLGFATVQPGGERLFHDIGVQFDDLEPPAGVCEYSPPGNVYDDGWGGIPGLRWMPNPWGETEVTETTEGCHDGSESCLRVDNMVMGSGMHLYIWQAFPVDAFDTLTVWGRTLEGSMDFIVSPSNDGTRCGEHEATVTTEWTEITINIADICTTEPILSSVTFAHGQANTLLLDDIEFH